MNTSDIKPIIRSLFRILTPEEISDLTTSTNSRKKVGLSLLLEKDLKGDSYKELFEAEETDEEETNEAKILPLNGDEVNESAEKVIYQVGEKTNLLLIEYSKVFQELDKKVLGPKRFPKRKSSSNKKQASVLILEQKEKLHASFCKIKSQEVYRLYKSSASVELSKSGNEEDTYSLQSGVLVNKRQS